MIIAAVLFDRTTHIKVTIELCERSSDGSADDGGGSDGETHDELWELKLRLKLPV